MIGQPPQTADRGALEPPTAARFPGHWASAAPDRPAVVDADTGERVSYGDLAGRAARFCRLLQSFGLQPGDRVALLLDNDVRFLEIAWGGLMAGVHVTTISRYATPDEAAYILTDSGAQVLVTSPSLTAVARDLPRLVPSCSRYLILGEGRAGFRSYHDSLMRMSPDPLPLDAPLGDFMLYSSGTTGRPKGVRRDLGDRTVADGPDTGDLLAEVFGFGPESTYLCTAPLYHAAPLTFATTTLALGGTVVLMRKFDPAGALQAIDRHRVTHSQWVPTMFVRLLRLAPEIRDRFDLSSHEVAIHSAAPCPRHVKEQMFAWWGPILHEYYSGTEGAGITYAGPEDWLAHPGTVGRPLGGAVHVCNEDGDELPAGQTGHIFFEQLDSSFTYHNDPLKTATARHPSHPNWVTLDDVGYLDDDGFLFLTDRASFMIISGGVNIYPREIEDCLLRHPSVADVAVIGVPDDEMGEEVKAVVQVVHEDAPSPQLASELMAFTRSELGRIKAPRTVDFTDSLPRLPTGKLAKAALRERYLPTETTVTDEVPER